MYMCDTTGYENLSVWGASSWERKLGHLTYYFLPLQLHYELQFTILLMVKLFPNIYTTVCL